MTGGSGTMEQWYVVHPTSSAEKDAAAEALRLAGKRAGATEEEITEALQMVDVD